MANVNELKERLRKKLGDTTQEKTSAEVSKKKKKNVLEKAWGGVQEFGLNVERGVLSAFEGVGDAALKLGAGASKLVGADSTAQKISRAADVSLTDKYLNSDLNQFQFGGVQSFISKRAKSNFDSAMNNEYLPSIVDSTAQGVGQTLGYMAMGNMVGAALPASTAGAGLGTKIGVGALKYAPIGLSAMGNSAVEASQNGASLGKQLAYGTVSGLIEAGTEAFVGAGLEKIGLGVNAIGFDLSKIGGESIGKNLLKSAFEEGVEEAVSDVFQPFAQMIYKDKNAWKNFQDNGAFQGMLEDFTSAFFSSLITGGVSTVSGVKSAGGLSNYKLQQKVQEVAQLNYDVQSAIGNNRAELETELNKKRTELIDEIKASPAYAELKEKMNELADNEGVLDEKSAISYAKSANIDATLNEEMNKDNRLEVAKDYTRSVLGRDVSDQETVIRSNLKITKNDDGTETYTAKKNNALGLKEGEQLSQERYDQLVNSNSISKESVNYSKTRLNQLSLNDFKNEVIHENIGHGMNTLKLIKANLKNANFNDNYRIKNYIKDNSDTDLAKMLSKKINNNETITKEEAAKVYKALGYTESEIDEEMSADTMGSYFKSLVESKKIMNSLSKTDARTILNKFINLYQNRNKPSNFEEIKKALREKMYTETDEYINKKKEAYANIRDGGAITLNKDTPTYNIKMNGGDAVLWSKNTLAIDEIRDIMKKRGFSSEDIDTNVESLRMLSDYLDDYGITEGFNRLTNNLNANVSLSLTGDGKVIFSALTKNGDYLINFDLSTKCKKREYYQAVIEELAMRGVFEENTLTSMDILDINKIMREKGYEMPCIMCFVENRRQFQVEWADALVTMWNKACDDEKITDYFNFGNTQEQSTLSSIAMALRDDSVKRNEEGNLVYKIKKAKDENGNKVVDENGNEIDSANPQKVRQIAEYLAKKGELKRMRMSDFLTTEGIKNIKSAIPDLFPIMSASYGAGTPKINRAFTPFNNEMFDLAGSVKKIHNSSISGFTKPFLNPIGKEMEQDYKDLSDKRFFNKYGFSREDFKNNKMFYKQNLALRRYLLSIGGVRFQSFSDARIEEVLDIYQLFNNASIMGYPMHLYSKEIWEHRLFGQTDTKMNISIIHQIGENEAKTGFAGLVEIKDASESVLGMTYRFKVDSNGKVALDENGLPIRTEDVNGSKLFTMIPSDFEHSDRVKAKGFKQSFIQSAGFKDAVALQLLDGYSKNVGTIAIGFSDAHILAMLDDPRIRMVIPYHRSGMRPLFMMQINLNKDIDYTDIQEEKMISGKKVPASISAKLGFNQWMLKYGDAKEAAKAYLKYCKANKVVPKFAKFSNNENYYKLLEDFNVYDSIDGSSAPQDVVKISNIENVGKYTEEQMFDYAKRLQENGFSSAEVEKYAGYTFKEDNGVFSFEKSPKYKDARALMTFKDILKKELDTQNANYKKLDAKFPEALKEIMDTMKRNHKDGNIDEKKEVKRLEKEAKLKMSRNTHKSLSNAFLEHYANGDANTDYINNNFHIENVDLKKLLEDNGLMNEEHAAYGRHTDTWGTDRNAYKFDDSKDNINSQITLIDNDGGYRIADGNHRVWALYNSGYKTADLLVRGKEDGFDIREYNDMSAIDSDDSLLMDDTKIRFSRSTSTSDNTEKNRLRTELYGDKVIQKDFRNVIDYAADYLSEKLKVTQGAYKMPNDVYDKVITRIMRNDIKGASMLITDNILELKVNDEYTLNDLLDYQDASYKMDLYDGVKDLINTYVEEDAKESAKAKFEKKLAQVVKDAKDLMKIKVDNIRMAKDKKIRAMQIVNTVRRKVNAMEQYYNKNNNGLNQHNMAQSFRNFTNELKGITPNMITNGYLRGQFQEFWKNFYNKDNLEEYQYNTIDPQLLDLINRVMKYDGDVTFEELEDYQKLFAGQRKITDENDDVVQESFGGLAKYVENVYHLRDMTLNGKKQNISKMTLNAQSDLLELKGKVKWDGAMAEFSNPITLARHLDGYKGGIFTDIQSEIINAEIKKGTIQREMLDDFTSFMKENKDFVKKLNKKFTIDGITATGWEFLHLYKNVGQPDSLKHMVGEGETGGYDFIIKHKLKANEKLKIRKDEAGWLELAEKIGDEIGLTTSETDANGNKKIKQTEQGKALLDAIVRLYSKGAKLLYNTDIELRGWSDIDINKADSYIQIGVSSSTLDVDFTADSFAQMFGEKMYNITHKRTSSMGAIQCVSMLDAIMSYVNQASGYAALTPSVNTIKQVFNYRHERNIEMPNGDLTVAGQNLNTVAEKVFGVGKDGKSLVGEYLAEEIMNIQGMTRRGSNSERKYQQAIASMRSKWVKFALFGNLKVILTQPASIAAARKYLDRTSIVKAFNVKAFNDVEMPELLLNRINDNGGLKQYTFGESVQGVGEFLGKGIQATDIFARKLLWRACLYQTLNKDGSVNRDAAIELYNKVDTETQPTYEKSTRSRIMNNTNEFVRIFTSFGTQQSKNLSILVEAIDRIKVKKAMGTLDASDWKNLARSTEGLVVEGALVTLIAMMFKKFFFRDDDDENKAIAFANDYFNNTIIGMMPFINDLEIDFTPNEKKFFGSNGVVKINELEVGWLTQINDFINDTEKFISKDIDTQERFRIMLYNLGRVTGIPTRNVYNHAIAVMKRIAPEQAWDFDSKWSGTNLSNKAIVKSNLVGGNHTKAKQYYRIYNNNQVTINTSVNDELYRLYSNEVKNSPSKTSNVSLKTIPTDVTIDGKKIEINRDQFVNDYKEVATKLNSLINSSYYQRLSDDARSDAVQKVINIYYNIAKANQTGESYSKNMYVASIGALTPQLLVLSEKINDIVADKKHSKKELVQKFIERQAISKREKYLLYYLAGYKLNEEQQKLIKPLLRRGGLSKKDIDSFFGN